jgi:hypothetical protein
VNQRLLAKPRQFPPVLRAWRSFQLNHPSFQSWQALPASQYLPA